MMHHLLVTLGSHGDTHPFIGLGLRLQQRGHRVTIAANETFGDLIRSVGLEFELVGTAEQYTAAIQNPDLWNPRKGFKTVAELGMIPFIRPAFDIIKKLYVPGQTMVSAHGIAFGARVAQEVLKCPLATIHLSPCIFQSAEKPPVFAGAEFLQYMPRFVIRGFFNLATRFLIDPALAGPLNEFRSEFGLSPVKNIIREYWNSPSGIICLWPQWFAPAQSDWPKQVHLTGFPLFDEKGVSGLSPELNQFISEGTPPVAFTFGSAMVHAKEQMQTAIEACRLSNQRGVLLTRFRDQIPDNLPSYMRHFDYAPFSELLPKCALLIHHGGIGTMSQAIACGTPQIIMPLAHDQHDNAHHIKQLGIGDSIPPNKFKAKRVAKVITDLIGNLQVLANCKQVAERFKGTDPLADACDQIELIGNNTRLESTSLSPVNSNT